MNISITNLCNRRCEYCFQRGWYLSNKAYHDRSVNEMNINVFKDIIRWVGSQSNISIMGGEPLFKVINNLISGRLAVSFNSKCPTLGRDVLTFDLKGDLIVCHNTFPHFKCSGNVKDLNTCYTYGLQSFHSRKECVDCWMLACCGGSCPLDDNYQHLIECESVQWFDRAYMRAAWTIIFGEDIKMVEKVK